MNHTRLWLAAAIIAVCIILGFVLTVPRTQLDMPRTVLTAAEEAVWLPSVTIRDVYKKGVHTLTGTLEAPNACAAVTSSAAYVDGTIAVALTMTADTGICLQIPTRISFQTTVTAPASVPITATVNGTLASTTAP